jgi:dihydropteroate synthase
MPETSRTRQTINWALRGRTLTVGDRPLIMGIVNVTPDSFSDGGAHAEVDAAVAHGIRLAEEGADIIDIGGESTRPGAEPVSVEAELQRTLPVVTALAAATPAVLSIDTTKAEVAGQAVAAGAGIINDVSALTQDPQMVEVAARTGAGVILMHMQGTPRTMQDAPQYAEVVAEVKAYLADRLAAVTGAGVAPEAVAVDPGIGFGKTVDHNLALIAGVPVLAELGRPVVVGLSRKRFLGALTGREVADRLPASLAGLVAGVLGGAHVMRVHDVAASVDAARIAVAVKEAQP